MGVHVRVALPADHPYGAAAWPDPETPDQRNDHPSVRAAEENGLHLVTYRSSDELTGSGEVTLRRVGDVELCREHPGSGREREGRDRRGVLAEPPAVIQERRDDLRRPAALVVLRPTNLPIGEVTGADGDDARVAD